MKNKKNNKKSKLKISPKLLFGTFGLVFLGYFVAFSYGTKQLNLTNAETIPSVEVTIADTVTPEPVVSSKTNQSTPPTQEPIKKEPTKKPEPNPTPVQKTATPVATTTTPKQTTPSKPQNIGGSAETASSLSYINNLRASLGKSSLTQNSVMDSWALNHAKTLANECDLYHQNIAGFLGDDIGPVNVSSIAENVGYAGDIATVLENLKNSSGHYANMTGNYKYVGLGVVNGAGTCAGSVYTVQIFAK